MNASRAQLKFYRQSAKKVRQIANIIRGMSAVDAQSQLTYQPQRSAHTLLKLLNSAIANARDLDTEKSTTPDQLFIKEIRVDEGPSLKRYLPKAFGRATVVRKRMSHITLVLGKRKSKASKEPVSKKAKNKKQ